MKRVIDIIMEVLKWVTGIAFLLLFVLTIVNIALRYIAGIAWIWLPDFLTLLFVWVVFIGATVTYSRRGHLVVDFFVNRMQTTRRKVLNLIIRLSMSAFLTVLVIKGVKIAMVRMSIPFPMWDLPSGYAYLALPVSAFLMLLCDLEYFVGCLRHRRLDDERRS